MPKDPYKKIDPIWIGLGLIVIIAIVVVVYIIMTS
jgi:hypothetical protein